jgi:hypothetical protein
MRRTMLATAATVALLTVGAFLPSQAQAMTITAPVGLQAAIGDRLATDVAYVCRPVRRCGPWGCGWHRACWWTGPRYWGGGPYWRHRHYGYWHRW